MPSIHKKPKKKLLDISRRSVAPEIKQPDEQPEASGVKQPESVKRFERLKQLEPFKQLESVKPSEPIKQPEPVKQPELVRESESIKKFKPTIKPQPEKLKELDKEVEQFEKKEEFNFKTEEIKKREKSLKFKKWKKIAYIFLGSILILAAAGFYLANNFLAKAEIKIVTKKAEWSYIDSIMAAKNIAKIDAAQKQIPAEVFSVKKNFNLSFPATSKKSVQDKAAGKITIYNAYNSSPQVLMANTRLATPDGKIFRLVEKITVPGKPSSIEAEVIADKSGPDYNIGPISRFTIPGFQGSAKHEGFYGVSTKPMTGGFIGERPYPTDDDIKKAKQTAEGNFKEMTESSLTLQLPPEFKIIDGARQFSITKEKVNNTVDEKGNFTIFLEGQSSAIGFRESDLKALMETISQSALGGAFKIKTYNAEYGAGRADFTKGQVSYALNFKGIFEEPVDINSFTGKILGKSADDLKIIISYFPNIDKTTISFWPFWVKRIPQDLNRVKIEVE